MKKSRSVLIIGGTGFIGYHLAKKCLKSGLQVFSISTKKVHKYRFLKKVKYKICNINNFKLLKKSIKKNFDYVVNLGGYVDHKNKKKTYASHYLGVKNLYEVLKNKNLKKFIQIGSSSEYGKLKSPLRESSDCNPLMIYGKSKLKATQFLLSKYKSVKFPATILRFFQIYGPYQKPNRLIPIVITEAIKDKNFNCSDGKQSRDFLYVDDAVNSILKTLNNKKTNGKIINIGQGKPIMVKKVILMIVNMIQKGRPNFGKIKLRKDEPKILFPNIKDSSKILKWKTKISIKNGLLKTIKSYEKDIINKQI